MNKLDAFKYLNQEYSAKLGRGEKLTRNEWWIKLYYDNPYLASVDDEYVITRFLDIFNNTSTLTEKGQIGPFPVLEGEFFWSRFAHVLQETNYRPGVLQQADLRRNYSLRPTYPNQPAGKRILGLRSAPIGPKLIKLGKAKHLFDMFCRGVVRIAPASSYNDPSLNGAIRDNELTQHAVLKIESPGLHILTRDQRGNEIVRNHIQGDLHLEHNIDDFYIICLSHKYDYRLVDDFEADAMIVVHDTKRFVDRIARKVAKHLPTWSMAASNINYYDPFFVDPRKFGTGFMKHFRYGYQNEFRMRWASSGYHGVLQPFFVKIGSLRDISSYYTLPIAEAA